MRGPAGCAECVVTKSQPVWRATLLFDSPIKAGSVSRTFLPDLASCRVPRELLGGFSSQATWFKLQQSAVTNAP